MPMNLEWNTLPVCRWWTRWCENRTWVWHGTWIYTEIWWTHLTTCQPPGKVCCVVHWTTDRHIYKQMGSILHPRLLEGIITSNYQYIRYKVFAAWEVMMKNPAANIQYNIMCHTQLQHRWKGMKEKNKCQASQNFMYLLHINLKV